MSGTHQDHGAFDRMAAVALDGLTGAPIARAITWVRLVLVVLSVFLSGIYV
jgi:hypothetical protein